MNVEFCCLAKCQSEIEPSVPTFVHYAPTLASNSVDIARAVVVLSSESAAIATSLLEGGASRVLLGEAALLDGAVIDGLLKRFGAERLGVHVPVQRQAVSWAFDTESNADFRVVTPSQCEPAWEILRANGEFSGIRADKWIDEMLRRGLQSFLLRADIQDDMDLNLCAGMVEMLGDKLWLAPLNDPSPAIADWITFGQATQLALPYALYHRRHELLPRTDDADTTVVAG